MFKEPLDWVLPMHTKGAAFQKLHSQTGKVIQIRPWQKKKGRRLPSKYFRCLRLMCISQCYEPRHLKKWRRDLFPPILWERTHSFASSFTRKHISCIEQRKPSYVTHKLDKVLRVLYSKIFLLLWSNGDICLDSSNVGYPQGFIKIGSIRCVGEGVRVYLCVRSWGMNTQRRERHQSNNSEP